MKLGIIGAGAIVNDFLETIDRLDFERVAICATSRNIAHLEQIVKDYGFARYYTDVEKMLRDKDIDTVYVAVPNSLHYRFGRMALEAGKNVIMEKPFTSSLAQAEKLIGMAREKGLIILEAITTIHLPTYRKIRECLDKIGDLKIVSVSFSQYSSKYKAFKNGDVRPAFDVSKSGGALMDLNIYNIHFAVGLFGSPLKAEYIATFERDVDTSGILTLSYPDFKAVLIGAKDCEGPFISSLQGNEGTIWFDKPVNALPYFRCRHIGGEECYFERDDESRMYYEFSEFIRIINEDDHAAAEKLAEETIMAMRVLDEAKRSCEISFEADREI